MPLHLLPKKSWHLYNADNVARVRRDEALAAAAEEADEQRMQEEDAARRTAMLRGETPPPIPSDQSSALVAQDAGSGQAPSEEGKSGRDWDKQARKRMLRLKGEDDTDRDIRIAREDAEAGQTVRKRLAPTREEKGEVRITDEKGHIRLFDEPEQSDRRGSKQLKRKAEEAKRKKEEEETMGMRFSHAAGYNADKAGPWYASNKGQGGTVEVVRKDAFGREDPARKERDEKRVASTDPMGMMQRAQGQLKQVKREREQHEEKKREALRRLDEEREWEEEQRRWRRRRRRDEARRESGRRKEDEDSLDGFSLDPPKQDERRTRHHDRHDRHDRYEHRHRDRSHRSRSPDRKRHRDQPR